MALSTKQSLLAAAGGSPAAVARHDKGGWLALFGQPGLVNDPVGSAPHRGVDQLSAFYDTFIAPNDIRFEVHHDIVCGRDVVRDVTLEIGMSEAVRLRVPAHLRYAMTADARIDGLYAHWELLPMVGQLLANGVPAAGVGARLSGAMLRNQGFGGALGFARGFAGVGSRAKRRSEDFLGALSAGNHVDASAHLAPSCSLRFGDAAVPEIADLAVRMRDWKVGKVIAAGNVVSATMESADGPAVVMLEYRRRAIVSMVVFIDDDN